MNWRPSCLSALTQIMFNTELTHLDSEASNCTNAVNTVKFSKVNLNYIKIKQDFRNLLIKESTFSFIIVSNIIH